jgi:hypothetical protein
MGALGLIGLLLIVWAICAYRDDKYGKPTAPKHNSAGYLKRPGERDS